MDVLKAPHGLFNRHKKSDIGTSHLSKDQVAACEAGTPPDAATKEIYDRGVALEAEARKAQTLFCSLDGQRGIDQNALPGQVVLTGYQPTQSQVDTLGASGPYSGQLITDLKTNQATVGLHGHLPIGEFDGQADWYIAPALDGGRDVGHLSRVHKYHENDGAWIDTTGETVRRNDGSMDVSERFRVS